jgi:hypothetical protein
MSLMEEAAADAAFSEDAAMDKAAVEILIVELDWSGIRSRSMSLVRHVATKVGDVDVGMEKALTFETKDESSDSSTK